MSNQKEATARIKINKLLEESGWRFFADKNGKQNIQLETNVKWDDLGDDFQGRGNNGGFIDFLLLDSNDKENEKTGTATKKTGTATIL